MTEAAGFLTDGVLRPREDGLREAYLPTSTVQSHAANLAVLPDGDLACVWFGGTQEGVADISVWFSRRPLSGVTASEAAWSEPVALSDDGTRSEQNPVLFTAPDGLLWLVWTAQHAGNQDTAVVRARTSADSGRSWSDPRQLLAKSGQGVFVRQPPVFLDDGRWVVPTFACVPQPGQAWVGDVDTSSVWVSSDAGETWVEHPVPDSTGAVHMNPVPINGGYAAFYRSRWADFVHRSTSQDGVSWTPPEPIELPNNNSSVQATRLSDGPLAVVYNESSRANAVGRRASLYDEIDDEGIVEGAVPAVAEVTGQDEADGPRRAFWGAPRAPLSLALSGDDGVTWPARLVLADGDGYALSNNSRDGVNRELSYPSLIQVPNGDLHVAFTHHRRAIRHVVIPATRLADLRAAVD